jgi:hypothetical protein
LGRKPIDCESAGHGYLSEEWSARTVRLSEELIESIAQTFYAMASFQARSGFRDFVQQIAAKALESAITYWQSLFSMGVWWNLTAN